MKKNKRFLLISFLGIFLLVFGIIILFLAKDKIFDTAKDKILISYKYTGQYKNGYLSISDGKKYGYINSNGDVIFPLEYDLSFIIEEDEYLNEFYFVDGIAKYYDNGKYGLIDENGKVILNAYYEDLTIYSKDVILAVDFDGWYIINSKNERKNEFPYLQLYANSLDLDNFIVDNFDFKSGIIDLNNKTVVDFDYDSISYLYDESGNNFLYIALRNDNYSVYSNKLEQLKIGNISTIHWFEDNLLCYSDNNNVIHVFDITNNHDEIFDSTYTFVYKYTNDLALVGKNNKYGYINSSKEEVISLKYNYSATEFINGYASVCNASDSGIDCGIIDKTGKEVIGLKYDDIYVLSNNNFVVRDTDKFYIVDASDKKLTSEYSNITVIESGKYFIVTDSNNKVGILDSNYKIFEEVEYNDIKYNEGVFTLRIDDGFYLLKV